MKTTQQFWISLKGLLGRYWPLILPVLILIPSLASFPYASVEVQYSDLVITHYPNTLYVRQALWQDHRLPLWFSGILSGYPLIASPLSGLWYPPGWLALLLPLPFAFNLLVMLHLVWGSLGMYQLLRSEGRAHAAALFGALAFGAMPKLFAHYGAGHLTLLYAVPWTPWLLWAVQRRKANGGSGLACLEAAILALIFLADARWAAYAGIAWWLYALAHLEARGVGAYLLTALRRLPSLLGQTCLAACLSAPLALPLLEFVRFSSRAGMKAEDVFAYSLPPARLLGLAFPDFGGFHEWMLYPGGLVFALCLLALLWKAWRSSAGFWLGMTALSLLYAFGSRVPVWLLLARVPGFDLLRVPSRVLFITAMSLAALAASAVDRLLTSVSETERRRGGLLLMALAGFLLALAGGVWVVTGSLAVNFAWGGLAALVVAVWIGLRMRDRLSPRPWLVGLLCLCLLDWAMLDLSLFEPRSPAVALAEGQAAAQALASEPGTFRVYSPSYSLPQQTAANNRLQLADGIDPLQLQSYVEFMQRASGVPWSGYSVTLPPFANGDPPHDNTLYLPDPMLLGLLNVRYVAAEYDLAVDGLVLRSQFGETRLYENLNALPRAWVQPLDAVPGQDWQPVPLVSWTPERIEIDARGPGRLVLAEIFYPGWRAWVDGHEAPVEVVAGVLRSVVLTPGAHRVVFAFRPTSLYLGLGIGIVAVVCIALFIWLSRKDLPRSR